MYGAFPGGEDLFEGPAFGADAGLVPDERRVSAMKTLMRRVFDHARSRDMEVYLAVDVDCQTDHPQAILDTLPDGAKILVDTPAGPKAFVDPEHPDGVAVYRQIIANLLRDFPQVTRLGAWFRGKKSPWGLLSHLKVGEMPEAWRAEYHLRKPEFTEAMRFNATARPAYLSAWRKSRAPSNACLPTWGGRTWNSCAEAGTCSISTVFIFSWTALCR